MHILNRAFGSTDARNPESLTDFVGAHWDSMSPSDRTSAMRLIGPVPGFRMTSTQPWRQIKAAGRIGMTRCNDRQLAELLKRVFQGALRFRVDQFHAAIHPAVRCLVTREFQPEESCPSRDPIGMDPNAPDFSAARATLEEDLRPLFEQFTAIVACVGISHWREPARQAFESWCSPGTREKTPEFSVQADAAPVKDVDSDPSNTVLSLSSAEPVQEESEQVVIGEPTSTPETFTKLDYLLIDSVVASATGQHGAMNLASIEQACREFAKLNQKRAQSCFHWGFALGFVGAALPPHDSTYNIARRAWLVTGWLSFHARNSASSALERLRALAPADRDAILAHQPASTTAAPPIVKFLIANAALDELMQWISCLEGAPRDLVFDLRGLCVRLQNEGRLRELTQLVDGISKCPLAFGKVFSIEMRVAYGSCLRQASKFDAARDVLQQVEEVLEPSLEEGVGAFMSYEAALLLQGEVDVEQALCKVKIARIEEFWFSTKITPEHCWDRFHEALPTWLMLLEATEANQSTSVDLSYLALMVAACSPAGCADSTEISRRCHELGGSALRCASAAQATAREKSLLPRLRVLMAIHGARISQSEPACRDAVESIVHFERSEGELPQAVVDQVLEHALIIGVDAVADLICDRIERNAAGLIRTHLLDSALQHQAVQGLVLNRLANVVEKLSNAHAWQLRSALFAALVDSGVRDETVAELADDMIGVVMAREEDPAALINLFEKKERWQAVWQQQGEYAGVLAHLARRSADPGVKTAVAARLYASFFHVVQDTVDLEMACDYIDALRSLHAEKSWIEEAEQLFQRRQSEQSLMPTVRVKDDRRLVRVLFIGGDERQQHQEATVLDMLKTMAPYVQVSFEYPGWSSNWGAKVDRAANLIKRADIVVTLRFMRTLYGRCIRRLINEQNKRWRASIGHGPQAIARAIASAAASVRG